VEHVLDHTQQHAKTVVSDNLGDFSVRVLDSILCLPDGQENLRKNKQEI